MSQFETARQQIVQSAQELVYKGYLMATGGNLSMRILGQEAFAITPSNFDYLKMKPQDVCILDFELETLAGELKPFAAFVDDVVQLRQEPGEARLDPDAFVRAQK